MTGLRIEKVTAGYGQGVVLHGVSLEVPRGSVRVLLGANGAGKTTTLRVISGTKRPKSGRLTFEGQDLAAVRPEARVRGGIVHVPQGRGTFSELSVVDNLRLGAYTVPKDQVEAAVAPWFDRFPVLRQRRSQLAGTLSGGEQQMLAVARAMVSNPSLVLLDEPSLGLAPIIVAELFETLSNIAETLRTSMLIVEQSASLAIRIADYGYVMESGRIVYQGSADDLADNAKVRQAYLGI